MTVHQFTQSLEIKFWNVVIPVIENDGPLMKGIQSMKRRFFTKQSQIALLVLVWSAIGFVSGMIIGRVLWLLQIL